MTDLLRSMLRDDYLIVIKTSMLQQRHNNSSVARSCGYSSAHIGNVLKGQGSDDAIAAICKVLGLNIVDLYKPGVLDGNRKTA